MSHDTFADFLRRTKFCEKIGDEKSDFFLTFNPEDVHEKGSKRIFNLV